jgi:glycine/D-amino acid oxidase-like deaminating enzyme
MVVDVAILGGGYRGLWTDYYLLGAHPGFKVAIVEKKKLCAMAARAEKEGSSNFPLSPGMLRQRHGRDRARALLLAMNGAVDEVARIYQLEGIDACFPMDGILELARRDQLPGLRADLD